MQDRPDKATLLDAVAQFLTCEVRPRIQDRALSFRVLITANLASIVAREIRFEDTHDAAELSRLRSLLPDVDLGEDADNPDRRVRNAAIRTLNEALVERIRGNGGDEAWRTELWTHATHTLREKLAVLNPGFSLAPGIQ